MMNFIANLAALINEFAAYLIKKQMHGGCKETIMARNENHTAFFGKFAGFLAETGCVPREEVSGHYICYVKSSQGNWFKIDGSSVEPVELKRVLSEGAYMLLYARRSPRPPVLLGSNALSHVGTSNRRNSEAVPSSLSKSKLRCTVPSMNSSAGQPKSSRDRYRMNFDGSSNQSLDPDDWRSHSMYRAPAMDSSSESSSIFSSSVASSCSTVSTKDSSSNEDFSDYVFGQVGTNPYSQFRRSSDVVTPSLFPNFDVDMKGPTEDSEGGGNSTILYTDRGRHRRKSTSD